MVSVGKRSDYRRTFLVLAVGASSFSLLQSLVSPVLPLLQAELHTSQNTVTWVLTTYLLSASVFTPILGRVGDMIGKERVLVAVLLCLAVGSILAAVASSIGVMIVARAIQGVGGGVIPLSFGIVRDEFPREKVAGAVGAIAALLAVGGGFGLVLAGPIVDLLDYHWLFWIPGIVVTLAAVATHYLIPASPVRAAGKINWVAALLLSSWLIALLVAVSRAPSWGWASPRVSGLIVLALVLAGLWVGVELRSSHPLIDMRMMRIHAVWTTNLVAFLFGVGLYAVFAFLPQFLQAPSGSGYGFHASITESGMISLPQTATMFVSGVTSGALSRRFGSKAALTAGAGLSVPSFVILAFFHDQIWQVIVALMLMGAAFGLAFAAMSNIIVDAVPSHQTGVASGMNANIRTIGGSIGAAVVASVITGQLLSSGVPKESGYTHGFAVMGAIMIMATIACLWVPKLNTVRDAHQAEQAAMSHPELAILAAGTIVGDESE